LTEEIQKAEPEKEEEKSIKPPIWQEELKAQELARKLKELAEKGKVILKCGNCNVDVKDGDTFCWNCGNALEGTWIKKCSQCGKLFKTVKPKERDTCNKCEGMNRRNGALPGLFRY